MYIIFLLLTFTVSEILEYKIVDLQKVGQGHRLQFCYLSRWMAQSQNLELSTFALALIVLEIYLFFDLQKVGQCTECNFVN